MPGQLYAVHASGRPVAPAINPIRVVLADDHAPIRRSLRELLDREADLSVVGEASDLEMAMGQVRTVRPHVLVLDLRMPNGSIVDPIQRLHEQSRRTGIVVITMHDSVMFANHALEAGAIGVALKDAADVELPEAVRCAARGHEYRSPRLR